MGILAGRYADPKNYPSGSRASLRGGIYAERITARGIEVGNKFVELATPALGREGALECHAQFADIEACDDVAELLRDVATAARAHEERTT